MKRIKWKGKKLAKNFLFYKDERVKDFVFRYEDADAKEKDEVEDLVVLTKRVGLVLVCVRAHK
jgi:hypothetical protein